jgi:hypothetical protein
MLETTLAPAPRSVVAFESVAAVGATDGFVQDDFSGADRAGADRVASTLEAAVGARGATAEEEPGASGIAVLVAEPSLW